MDYRIYNLNDKWRETSYHIRRMKVEGKNFLKYDDHRKGIALRKFRYELNAFANSGRSITFVLQKTFNKGYNGFDKWYEKVQQRLKQNEFSQLLLEIRNKNQKEGNNYPKVISSYRLNDELTCSLIYSAAPTKVGLGDYLQTNYENVQITYDPLEELGNQEIEVETPKDASYEQVQEILMNHVIAEGYKKYQTACEKLTEEDYKSATLIGFRIELPNNQSFTIDGFVKQCEKYLDILKVICQESEKIFIPN